MKTKVLIVALISVTIAACKKDQFTTKPQLTFKKINATEFRVGDLIEFEIDYTDKEGDIQDSLYIEEVTLDPFCDANNDFRSHYQIPTDLPQQSQSKGTIIVRYIYGQVQGYPPVFPGPQCQRNDTCYFRFALKDKAQNTSDTIVSPQVVFVK